jgi:hypothetical protein
MHTDSNVLMLSPHLHLGLSNAFILAFQAELRKHFEFPHALRSPTRWHYRPNNVEWLTRLWTDKNNKAQVVEIRQCSKPYNHVTQHKSGAPPRSRLRAATSEPLPTSNACPYRRTGSRELQLPQTTVSKILSKRLAYLWKSVGPGFETRRFGRKIQVLLRDCSQDWKRRLSSKVHFSDVVTLHGKVNRHDLFLLGIENPHVTLQHERDSSKWIVFCSISKGKVYGSFLFVKKTVMGNLPLHYYLMLRRLTFTWLF